MSSSAPSGDFSTFQDGIFSAVMSTVKAVGALAAGDIDFQRSSDPEFASAADATSARILELANSLLRSAVAGSDIEPPVLREDDDVENKWGEIVEVADFLLERADTCLDEYTGAIKQKNPEPLPGARTNPRLSRNQQKSQNYRASANSWSSRNLVKPQLQFDVKPENLDNSPFRPLLTVKPHAKIPLQNSFEMFTNELGNKQYIHPYIEEIKSMKYPERMFQEQAPQQYLPFEDTEAIFVDSPELLVEMLEELKTAKEIAVDLEHHDQRSYVGFVCLMQISMREKDWIVDTLKLRGELQILNEVFADPNIIKVFHGAHMDIIWLQRDFGLYIVGLFDTYWAARTLGFQGHGLAFLLKKYVDFDADKQYQLADWRLRPIPEEMFNYARSDTHFLLYCFDNLRNELLNKSNLDDPENKMAFVLQNSQEVSLRLYEKEPYDAVNGDGNMGWRNMLGRSQEGLNPMQAAVFKAVHQWRDTTARIEDESVNYIMPHHQLFKLARKMPVDVAGVLSCCPRPSPPVKMRAGELVVVIKNAKDSPEVREWKKSIALEAEAVAKASQQAAPASIDILLHQGPRIDVFTTPLARVNMLRNEKSGFWGSCDESSRWNAGAITQKDADLRLAVPLPQLTAAVFISSEDDSRRAPAKSVDPGARAEHEYIKNRTDKKDDTPDVIVVRSLGGGKKRKRPNEATGDDDAAVETESGEAEAEKAATSDDPEPRSTQDPTPESISTSQGSGTPDGARLKEKEKSRRRKKKKGGEKVEEDAEEGGSDKPQIQPFDYANAPSVLNQKQEKEPKSKEKKKKAFNPYSQSGNAPKGLSRKNQERAGKSSTFKQ
ncbi:hypothetical protein K440DRAFT_619784 [Wilcoxina mikolae CBS 423.85]|nr:hypothetical protein K440DRAFT_619784 [Wilcoxina mikolae CBS 423.85]